MLFLSVILTGRDKIHITLLKSLWCDQTCELIKISLSRMRVCDNYVSLDEYNSQFTDLVIKQMKLVE